ncbi:MAG TPA: DUF2330 domain-containing protein [Candidatus Binataceae bacterium]|nr:DUF2330 domain-containing protein [Candidatus Binataceae bacterium]
MKPTRLKLVVPILAIVAACAVLRPPEARAFCGFYVGKADSNLFNHASQVVMVRHGDKTVLSLMNDYQGEPTDFAMVIPVPEVLQKEQIHIGDREVFKKLDEYSSPRLVEYFDPDPCEVRGMGGSGMGMRSMAAAPMEAASESRGDVASVKVEAQYTVGEYDIVILSAKQSDGLETWLHENGYKIPLGAHRALEPYIRQDMKFFVAKVNLKEHQASGLDYLRPIQFAFQSPKFMLPIRLGMINAQGPQDLIVYALTEDGRVETTNYRTEKVPTGEEIPEYVQAEFQDFYKSVFSKQVDDNAMKAVFTEYVWNMGWCDPCAGPPLSREELKSLGVFWLDEQTPGQYPMVYRRPPIFGGGAAMPVMLTRLHVRYSADRFPEDLAFQETGDRENFQARYVLQHPWRGSPDACPAAARYFSQVRERENRDAQTLAELTGWNLGGIMKKVGLPDSPLEHPWWKGLWD